MSHNTSQPIHIHSRSLPLLNTQDDNRDWLFISERETLSFSYPLWNINAETQAGVEGRGIKVTDRLDSETTRGDSSEMGYQFVIEGTHEMKTMDP